MTVAVLSALRGPGEAAVVTALEGAAGRVSVTRRCADLAELLGAADAGLGQVTVLSPDLPLLDREAVARLRDAGVRVVALVDGDARAAERMTALGVDAVADAAAPLGDLVATVLALADADVPAPRPRATGTPEASLAPSPVVGSAGQVPPTPREVPPRGRVVAVWGPTGAPGRTTVAVNLAAELAALERDAAGGSVRPGRRSARAGRRRAGDDGHHRAADAPDGRGRVLSASPDRPARAPAPDVAEELDPAAVPDRTAPAAVPDHTVPAAVPDHTVSAAVLDRAGPAAGPGDPLRAVAAVPDGPGGVLLVDADTYGGTVAQVVGLLDEAPGIAAAARAAGQGVLDDRGLARLTPVIGPGLRVLTGISRADRWPELPGSALDLVWETARQLATWVVVDCGFSLEQDEVLSYDTQAPRRNAATLSALDAADVVVVVGLGDPVGVQRLVRGLTDLADSGAGSRAERVVVVNRVRASAAGPHPERAVADALERYAGVTGAHLLPDDRSGVDAALLTGGTLAEAAAQSPVRTAIARLAAELAGVPPGVVGVRRRRGLRSAARA